jgi:hypothetical protein
MTVVVNFSFFLFFLLSRENLYTLRINIETLISIELSIYYTYIRISHYQSFNVILFICKLFTLSIVISSINLYHSHATVHNILHSKNLKIIYVTHTISF